MSKKVKQEKAGRPANQKDTIKFTVLSLIRAVDKAGKLEDLNSLEVVKKVKEKFPDSKFTVAHVSWYTTFYKRLKKDGSVRKYDEKAA